jgi:hypothetical protein
VLLGERKSLQSFIRLGKLDPYRVPKRFPWSSEKEETMSRRIFPMLLVLMSAAPAAHAGSISDFAVFGNSGVTYDGNVSGGLLGSNGDVTLNSFATVSGVAGGGSLSVSGGFDTINGPVSFNHDVSLGTFGVINGNVAAGGNVTVNGTINGNVAYGGTLNQGPFGTINGTTTQVPGIMPYSPTKVPAADKFTAGGADVNVPTFASQTLAPGSYGALTLGTSPFGDSTLTLTAGNYYFNSITSEGDFNNLNLDLASGAIHIFVTGDINLGGAFTTEVNGAPASGADSSLAREVLLETHGNVNGSGFFTTTTFFGTIFTPNGNISTGFDSHFIGSLVAGGSINSTSTSVEGEAYKGFAATPEPSSLALFGLGAMSLLGYGWRQKQMA